MSLFKDIDSFLDQQVLMQAESAFKDWIREHELYDMAGAKEIFMSGFLKARGM